MQMIPDMKKGARYAFCYIFTPMMLFACGNEDPLPVRPTPIPDTGGITIADDTIRHGWYHFDLYDIPIVEENYAQAFLGNVINIENSSARHLVPLSQPQYNKVSAMLTYGAELKEFAYVPSLPETQKMIMSLKESDIEQNERFTFSQNWYNTPREIRLGFGGSDCILLDSLCLQNEKAAVSGHTYLVYSLNQVMARLALSDETEDILAAYPSDKMNYGCINAIALGKACYVVASIDKNADGNADKDDPKSTDTLARAVVVTFDRQCRPIVNQRTNLTKQEILKLFNEQPIRPLSFSIFRIGNGEACSLGNPIDMK